MKLKKLVTITSLLLMLLLVFSSCENKVTTTLLTIDLDYTTPVEGQTVQDLKKTITVYETWTTGTSKGLRSTDDVQIIEDETSTVLADDYKFVANKTYKIELIYKYYDSTEKTAPITRTFKCLSSTYRVELTNSPYYGQSLDEFKNTVKVYNAANALVTSGYTVTVENNPATFAIGSYNYSVTIDNAVVYSSSFEIKNTYRVELTKTPYFGQTVEDFKKYVKVYDEKGKVLDGVTIVVNAGSELSDDSVFDNFSILYSYTVKIDGKEIKFSQFYVENKYIAELTTAPYFGQTVKDFKKTVKVYDYSASVRQIYTNFSVIVKDSNNNALDDTATLNAGTYKYLVSINNTYISYKDFTIGSNYRVELAKTPYTSMPYDDFIKIVNVYDNNSLLESGSYSVKLTYDGTTLTSGDNLNFGDFDYSVYKDSTCIYKSKFSTKSPRYATKVTLVNRYVVRDDEETRNYVASTKTYNFYDTINEYGGKKYTAPEGAETDEFKLSDLALYVTIEFNDGSKITQMPISNSNLPGYVSCKVEGPNNKYYTILDTNPTASEPPMEMKDLVASGLYSGIYDIFISFTYDIQKGEALRSRALDYYEEPKDSVFETLPGAFVFNTYFPVIFKDNPELANTKDQYKTKTLTINGVEAKQRFVFTTEEVNIKAGTQLDNSKYGNGRIFTIGNTPTLVAIPTAVDLNDTDEFGHVWLRYSTDSAYQGTIDTRAKKDNGEPIVNDEFGRYVGAYNADDTRFVFDHWNNAAETEEAKKNVSKADYSVTVDKGVATGNILTAQYTLAPKTEKLNNVDFVKVPVGFQIGRAHV